MKAKRVFPVVIAVCIFGLFGGTLWFLWAKSRPKPVATETEHPLITDIVKKVIASGTIEPRKEVEIKPRISGILKILAVQPGQKVKKGDLIGEVEVIPDVVNLNEAELRLRSARLAAERAKRELDRAEQLGARGAAAQTELDKLRSDHALAEEELHGAESRVRLVREGTIGRAKGNTASTRVESTVDGTVLTTPVKEGSSVINASGFNPGTTIAAVADMSDMVFRGRVDESEVGKLERIAPKSQVKDGSTEFEIEAAFRPPSTAVVRAGYSANANIVLDRRDKVLAINESVLLFEKDLKEAKDKEAKDGKEAKEPKQDPKPAVVDDAKERRYVEVEVGPQHFERRQIQLGLSDGVRVEVLSGLAIKDTLRKPKRAGAGGKL